MPYTALKQLIREVFHKHAKTLSCMLYKGLKDIKLYHLTFVCSHEQFHILIDVNQNYHPYGALHLNNKHRLH